jgi:hypothetical protein
MRFGPSSFQSSATWGAKPNTAMHRQRFYREKTSQNGKTSKLKINHSCAISTSLVTGRLPSLVAVASCKVRLFAGHHTKIMGFVLTFCVVAEVYTMQNFDSKDEGVVDWILKWCLGFWLESLFLRSSRPVITNRSVV